MNKNFFYVCMMTDYLCLVFNRTLSFIHILYYLTKVAICILASRLFAASLHSYTYSHTERDTPNEYGFDMHNIRHFCLFFAILRLTCFNSYETVFDSYLSLWQCQKLPSERERDRKRQSHFAKIANFFLRTHLVLLLFLFFLSLPISMYCHFFVVYFILYRSLALIVYFMWVCVYRQLSLR